MIGRINSELRTMAPNPAMKGIPLILFMIGGSYTLSTFVQGRVESRDTNYKSQSRREFTLEQEHEVITCKHPLFFFSFVFFFFHEDFSLH